MSAGARKVEVTVESLLRQLEDAITGATQAGQFSAVSRTVRHLSR
jgi:hypothetical protein